MAQYNPDLTIVLLGTMGSGKSTAANAILGRDFFGAKSSPVAVTQQCATAIGEVEGRTVIVIDTPGLSSEVNDQLRNDIEPFLRLRPHVFLLAIRVNDKITGEVKNAVKWIEENLGRDVLCYVIILFTYVDQLQGTSLQEYCRASQFIRSVINSCGGRSHPFSSVGGQNNSQVRELIQKIDRLVWWNSDQARYNFNWFHEVPMELQ